jgi:hypothetical protein
VLLVVVTLVPHLPFQASPAVPPPFFTAAAQQRFHQGEVVLVAPFSATPAATDPLLWQAASDMRFKLPEGYLFTAGPGNHPRLGPAPFALSDRLQAIFNGAAGGDVTADEVVTFRADLVGHGVEAVVVGPMPHQGRAVALFTAVLGRPPEVMGGVLLWPVPPRSRPGPSTT